MSPSQRYISRELTHFVGRELSGEEEQYLLVVEILTSGWLTHKPHIPPFISGDPSGLVINIKARISANEMFSPRVVCFCDIPVMDLPIHMNKYSRFGLSFLKSFLVSKGANPVFYIAKNSVVGDPAKGYSSRAEEFDKIMDVYHSLYEFAVDALSRREGKGRVPVDATQKFVDVQFFLDRNIFSFMKLFDDSLPDEDAENFYMEREWRIMGNLQFNLDEVYRVILPRSFAGRFRKDFPKYMGQVTFTD